MIDKKKGKLFVISAPSGTGKTTIARHLLKITPGIVCSISVTTRAKRKDEKEAGDYYFITKDEFTRRKNKGEFLEWAKVFGNFYATPKDFVVSWLSAGKDVILTIDVQGAMKVKKAYPLGKLIFVLPPSMQELKKRLFKRKSERKQQIKKRLEIAKKEICFADKYDYVVINDTLNSAVEEIGKIINKERKQWPTQI